jgi:hypoxanthine phosphoribosyltransferase
MFDIGASEIETHDLSKEKFPSTLLAVDEKTLLEDIDTREIAFLIGTDGSKDRAAILTKGIINLSNLIVSEHADILVLLDKSARPVAHLLKAIWRDIYPDFNFPEIKFVNIGRNDESKYADRDTLKTKHLEFADSTVKNADVNIDDKTVLVADEAIKSGESIKLAKKILEGAFPNTKKMIYTSVFSSPPAWVGKPQYLGVYDWGDLPFNQIFGSEQDTFVSKSIAGVVKIHPDYVDKPFYDQKDLDNRQANVNELRDQLSYLGKKIARHSRTISKNNEVLPSNLPPKLNMELNVPSSK